jgi:hypothetical protein
MNQGPFSRLEGVRLGNISNGGPEPGDFRKAALCLIELLGLEMKEIY